MTSFGVKVYYPTANEVARALAPEFELVRVAGDRCAGAAVVRQRGSGAVAGAIRGGGPLGGRVDGLPRRGRSPAVDLPAEARRMIILLHPKTVRPKNRRFPLAILAVAAALEGREEYTIVDGNLDTAVPHTLDRLVANHRVEMLAVSVMPGPQMVAAIPLCREFKRKYPSIPIVWGGYFPSLYTDAALNAAYVDYAVRGQGEETIVELLAALRGERDVRSVAGRVVQGRLRAACAQCEPGSCDRRTTSPGCRITGWNRLNGICCRRFWASARRCIRRASGVRTAASSAAWCRSSTGGRRRKRRSARPRCWGICNVSSPLTRCSSMTTTSSWARAMRGSRPSG